MFEDKEKGGVVPEMIKVNYKPTEQFIYDVKTVKEIKGNKLASYSYFEGPQPLSSRYLF